jgi:hypothetical protein
MLNKDQNQNVGNGAAAIQAGNNVYLNVGITSSEARQIALDVAKSTFYELAGVGMIFILRTYPNIKHQYLNF